MDLGAGPASMGRTAGSFAASSSRRHPAGSGGSGGGDSRAEAGGRARAIILLCLVALGIQSCLAQQPPEQCDLATFSAGAGSVDEACCDGAASSCPDGIPELCNTACSGVFTDFYDRCREFLAAQVGEDMVGYDGSSSCAAVTNWGSSCSTPSTKMTVRKYILSCNECQNNKIDKDVECDTFQDLHILATGDTLHTTE